MSLLNILTLTLVAVFNTELVTTVINVVAVCSHKTISDCFSEAVTTVVRNKIESGVVFNKIISFCRGFWTQLQKVIISLESLVPSLADDLWSVKPVQVLSTSVYRNKIESGVVF